MIIPFKEDFGKLTTEQMENFKATIGGRIRTYVVGFSKIISSFLNIFRENWMKSLSEEHDSSSEFTNRIFDFESLWVVVKGFLKETYVYKNPNLFDESKIKLTYPEPNIYSAIKSTLELYDLSINVNEQLGSF